MYVWHIILKLLIITVVILFIFKINNIIYNSRQQEAEDELNVVLKELRTKQKMLADVEERLQKLEDIYDRSVSEKNKLELNIERTQSRLNRSDLLVAALSDEQQRWENSLKVFLL